MSKNQAPDRKYILSQFRIILEPWTPEVDLLENINEKTDLLTDFAIDSVALLQLILDLEETFDIKIPAYQLNKKTLSILANFIDLIQEKINENH